MDAALAIARAGAGDYGQRRMDDRPGDGPDLDDAPPAADRIMSALAGDAGGSGLAVGGDEQAAAELVLPLMESAQTLVGQLAALTGVDLAQLPAPWESFAREALTTILTTVQPYLSPRQG